jgi:predicted ATPase
MSKTPIRLRELSIRDFKAIDQLTLPLPAPKMTDDLDVFVLGSRNGLGKTSILEACSLLMLAINIGKRGADSLRRVSLPLNVFDLIVRSGSKRASVEGIFDLGASTARVRVELGRLGELTLSGDSAQVLDHFRQESAAHTTLDWEQLLSSLIGMNPNPLMLPSFIYFHSYRKVQEGSPEFGMMVEDERSYYRSSFRARPPSVVSAFKLDLLRSLMSIGGLFEGVDRKELEGTLETLNDLVNVYAGGRIEKLRPLSNNTIEFLVTCPGRGGSFTFDGLSSGQKEIISTLYLIWRHTRNQPGIILVDEPELHLNAQWHMEFVAQLRRLAPKNQYLIATHSEDVFATVEADRRILLEN